MRIPQYAKNIAKSALELRERLPESKKFGLDKAQANELGINSGVERAKQIINKDYLPYEDVKRVCAFSRFLNQKPTQKVQGSIDLWGGRRFIKKACNYVKK